MRLLVSLVVLLTVAGCDRRGAPQNFPKSVDVQRLEALLARNDCIGDLGHWERRYRLWMEPTTDRPKSTEIEFNLRQASREYKRAGRFVEPPRDKNVIEIDDTPVKVAFGMFETTSGRLELNFCGSNFPEANSRRANGSNI